MGRSDTTDHSDRMNTPEDVLAHFGIKGMKWGVRKNDSGSDPKVPTGELVLTKQFKTGDSISIYKKPPSKIGSLVQLALLSKEERKGEFTAFALHDKEGKKVGDASIRRTSKDSLYLNWIGIKPKHRGKGYASAALKGVLKYAKSEGISQLKLEVPGNSPDARHIYEKLGFRMDGRVTGHKDDVWGGLYGMVRDVDVAKHVDDVDAIWEEEFADEFAKFLIDNFGSEGDPMAHATNVDDFLTHFGVMGMKWGTRKKQNDSPVSADAAKKTEVKEQVKKNKITSVSNAQLQAAINRMQLEQNYKRLAVNEKPAVTRFISSTLLEIGKREVQAAAAKKVAGLVARKVATGGLG